MELELLKGKQVTIVTYDNDYWWTVKDQHGNIGWVPSTVLRFDDDKAREEKRAREQFREFMKRATEAAARYRREQEAAQKAKDEDRARKRQAREKQKRAEEIRRQMEV